MTDRKAYMKEYQRLWHLRNKEKQNARAIEWYRKNKQAQLERQSDNYAEINARNRERYHSEPEYRRKTLAYSTARKWRVPYEEYEAFKAMYAEDCFYCGDEGGSVDHLVPRSKGGADRLYNLVPCCKSCNSSKHDNTPGEWYDAAGSAI